MTAPRLTLSRIAHPPSKPPRRAWRCTIEAEASGTSGAWLLLPQPLEARLTQRMRVPKIDLCLDAPGRLYLQSNGEIGFAAFRLAQSGRLTIADWEFSTFSDSSGGQAVFAKDLRFSSGDTLSGLARTVLSPPAELPVPPAVLAQWQAPSGTEAVPEDFKAVPFSLTA